MTYQEFVEYCLQFLTMRMSETTANILIEELFPVDQADLWESHMELSGQFLVYAEKVLNGE